MRILNYAKINFIKTKSAPFYLLFPLLSVFLLVKEADTPAFFACLYCLFSGIILGTMSLYTNCKGDSGFLKMLPSKCGDEMRGHFLYSFTTLFICMVLSLAAIALARLIRPEISLDPVWIYPVLFGIALIFTALENLLLCLFHYDNAQAMQLLRIAPGFLFFFGSMVLFEQAPQFIERCMSLINQQTGWLFVFLCFLVFWGICQICVIIDTHRDN